MNDEAHLSAEQSGSEAPSRFPRPSGDRGWPQHPARAPRSRSQEPVGLSDNSREAGPVATIAKRADFLAANKGKRQPMPGFVLLVHDRADGDQLRRIGITVTKKIGGAVVRNRMKRRFRALARELLPTLGVAGADHVLIGRAGGIERDYGLLRAELEKALRKIARAPAPDQTARDGIHAPRKAHKGRGKGPADSRGPALQPADADGQR
jgi:ribonuclease P protein component